jgi:predicted  nucleic acid-binding Zn-ribbon protein
MNNEEKILNILEGMQGQITDMQGQFAGMQGQITGMQGQITDIQTDLKDVKSELGDVKDRVILIENDHGKEIKALHDGYVMLYDISKEIRDEIRKIHLREQRQDARLTNLELGFDQFERKMLPKEDII